MLRVSEVRRFGFATLDPEESSAWLREAYTDHTTHVIGDPSAFRFTAQGLATDRFRLDRLAHTLALETRAEPFPRLCVCRVHAGRLGFARGGEELSAGPGDLVLLDPSSPSTFRWTALEVDVVALDLSAAHEVAGQLSGLDAAGVRFRLGAPVSVEQALFWTRTHDHVLQVLAETEGRVPALLRAELLRVLATATVLAFPSTALAVLDDPPGPGTVAAAPAAVRRAVAFIEANAQREISVTDIAEAARLSPRGLQHAFRRHQGTTPLELLRQVRLDGARGDLADSEPGSTTVGEVAARWGFGHRGRFAALYRAAFGEPPSATLLR